MKSNLWDYNDTCILVRGIISIAEDHGHQAVFKNCASFTKCITKIDGTANDNPEDLEYSSNYSDIIGSLWFFYQR